MTQSAERNERMGDGEMGHREMKKSNLRRLKRSTERRLKPAATHTLYYTCFVIAGVSSLFRRTTRRTLPGYINGLLDF